MDAAPGDISPILMANVLGDVGDIVVRAFQKLFSFTLHFYGFRINTLKGN